MTRIKTRPFDAAEYLESERDMSAYLEAALEEGEPALVARALGAIARARGMADVARATGLRRESLYKALSPNGNPEFATVLKVIQALGIRLHVEASSSDLFARHGSGRDDLSTNRKALLSKRLAAKHHRC